MSLPSFPGGPKIATTLNYMNEFLKHLASHQPFPDFLELRAYRHFLEVQEVLVDQRCSRNLKTDGKTLKVNCPVTEVKIQSPPVGAEVAP